MPGRASADDPFGLTRWSLVARAGKGDAPQARAALAELCRSYWKPVYGYVRRRHADEHEALDRTQAFFAHLLEKDLFQRADPQRGKFRAFLLTALKHFLINEADRERRRRPAGGAVFSLDNTEKEMSAWEPADNETPERAFERQWALSLLENVLQRLRQEMETDGRGPFFDACKGFLSGEETRPMAVIAAELQMSEGALKVAVHRLRKRYRAGLRAEVAQTVENADEVDGEVRDLLAALAR